MSRTKENAMYDPIEPLIGTRVRVYWNLHKKCYSVLDHKGRVAAHVGDICLQDVRFVVRAAGRRKVLQQRRKNVHAFVVGTVSHKYMYPVSCPTRVSYNPYRSSTFEDQMGRPIAVSLGARLVTSDNGAGVAVPKVTVPAY